MGNVLSFLVNIESQNVLSIIAGSPKNQLSHLLVGVITVMGLMVWRLGL